MEKVDRVLSVPYNAEGGDRLRERIINIIEAVFKECGSNYSKASAKIFRKGKPMLRQSLFKMVKSGSIRFSTFLEVLDAHDLHIVIADKKDRIVFDESDYKD